MKLLLSIITINYNNHKGLDSTIQSVISQTYQDFEFLIIDGGSIDESVTNIERQSGKIDYWVSEPDKGIYNAMNKGIAKATGDYLLFLNSGDVLNGNTALENFIRHKDFQGDIIYGDYKFEEGEKIYPDLLTPLFFIRSSLPHQSTFFKRVVFEKMGNYNESYGIVADRAFYIKCYLRNEFKFQHIHYPLTLFDLKGISNNPIYKEKGIVENELMFKELYGIFYEDYKRMNVMISEINQLKRETTIGVWKRIMYKIKKVCRIQ